MTLAYERRGAGEPLVLIHPLGGDRHVWAPVMDLLAESRDVIAVDLPGFGRSPLLEEEPTPFALAAAVTRFAATELGIERPHVAGNSLGGWVALEMALAGDAQSVTAIAPAGLWGRALGPRPTPGRAVARAAAPLLGVLALNRRLRLTALSTVLAHPERVPARDAARIIRAYAGSAGYVAANTAMRAGFFRGLADIRVPVTLAWPDHDRLVRRPARLPANVRNVVLRDCGHLAMWDDPEQVAAVLLEGTRERLTA
jgi:pimeloyl-ACP methyl ester carboxylesterase